MEWGSNVIVSELLVRVDEFPWTRFEENGNRKTGGKLYSFAYSLARNGLDVVLNLVVGFLEEYFLIAVTALADTVVDVSRRHGFAHCDDALQTFGSRFVIGHGVGFIGCDDVALLVGIAIKAELAELHCVESPMY